MLARDPEPGFLSHSLPQGQARQYFRNDAGRDLDRRYETFKEELRGAQLQAKREIERQANISGE